MRSKVGWIVGMTFIVAVAAPARADIAPPGSCTAPGQPCSNAGTSHDQPGTCAATTCSKTVPLADGGTTTSTYPCNLCQASGVGGAGGGAGGAGGRDVSDGGGAGGGGAPDAATTKTPSSSACAIGGSAGGSSLAGAFLLAGVLAISRRRRRVR